MKTQGSPVVVMVRRRSGSRRLRDIMRGIAAHVGIPTQGSTEVATNSQKTITVTIPRIPSTRHVPEVTATATRSGVIRSPAIPTDSRR